LTQFFSNSTSKAKFCSFLRQNRQNFVFQGVSYTGLLAVMLARPDIWFRASNLGPKFHQLNPKTKKIIKIPLILVSQAPKMMKF